MEGVMAGAYPNYGSYILYKEFTHDVLGHLYRAGELGRSGVRRTVFLRILDAPEVPVEDVIEAFPLARRLARELTAANVASGIGYLAEGNVPALVCDYLSAQPLNLVLDKARSEDFPIPVDNALLVLEKIALALTAGLAIDIDGTALVHGFLHPGLILLSTDGEAVVSGFGVAARLLGMLGHHEVAQHVHPYLAPEVLLTRTPSKRGDVYSLGALLVQLLTGTAVPAEPEERIGLLDRVELANDEQPLPEDLKGLLRRAIAPRPEKRFSSAVEFKKELDRLLYGGSYSPTTFNLALFMDRLFRAEIQAEERERASEVSLDVTAYLAHESAAAKPPRASPTPPRRRPRAIWIAGVIAAATAAVATWWALAGRLPNRPEMPPTPTAEQIAAQRQQEEDRLQTMVQDLVQQKMAEKEEEIRQELLDRQAKIDDLQRRLRASEQRARTNRASPEEQRQQETLQQQITAEEEAQRRQQSELAEAGSPGEVSPAVAAAEAVAGPEPVEPSAATPEPTVSAPPTPTPGPVPKPTKVVVVENSFIDPTEVDTLPVVLKDYPVTWPRMALHSRRQGVVIVQVTVNAEGGADQVKVLRADHEGFGIPQAVVEAVYKYRFKPATKGGVRVTSYATVTRHYQFQDR